MKDQNYREELQNRTIVPSSDSWEKLNARLAEHEHKEKRVRWRFFKVASVVLVFISVGFYFLKPAEHNINTPIIATPSLKDNVNTSKEINDVIETEIAETPKISTIKKKLIPDSQLGETIETEVALTQALDKNQESANKQIKLALNDSIAAVIVLSEIPNAEAQFIDEEVEQLLNKSKIKLVTYGQISSNKVSANALLNSVEEDLYKDLKQKLIEKIANKLKNPKEVVTSREN